MGESESEGMCTSPNKIFVVLLLVLNFGILGFANVQAYRARGVAVEFSESSYIARAMGMILVVFFVAVPLFFLVERDPRATFFVKCTIVFVVCVAVLCFIFLPKIIYHHSNRRRTHSDAVRASLPTTTQRSSSSNTQRSQQQPQQKNNDTSSSLDEQEEEGCKIMEHPKLRQELSQRIQDLENDKLELSTRITELESLLLQQSSKTTSSATTDNDRMLVEEAEEEDKI